MKLDQCLGPSETSTMDLFTKKVTAFSHKHRKFSTGSEKIENIEPYWRDLGFFFFFLTIDRFRIVATK